MSRAYVGGRVPGPPCPVIDRDCIKQGTRLRDLPMSGTLLSASHATHGFFAEYRCILYDITEHMQVTISSGSLVQSAIRDGRRMRYLYDVRLDILRVLTLSQGDHTW